MAMSGSLWNDLVNLAVRTCRVGAVKVYRYDSGRCEMILVADSSRGVLLGDERKYQTLLHRVRESAERFEGDLSVEIVGSFTWGLIVPIMQGDRTWGVMGFYSETPIRGDEQLCIDQVVHLTSVLVRAHTKPIRRFKRTLSATVKLDAEERLRREIAEELHGSIQTKMLLISYKLEHLKRSGIAFDKEGLTMYQEALEDLESLREEDIRALSHRLHPGLIRVGIRPALQQLQRSFKGHAEVHLDMGPEIAIYDHPLENRIGARIRLVAYRVVEESILNAVRHGHAKHITVNVTVSKDQWLAISVSDDGAGFDSHQEGLGLALMRCRVKDVRGTLSVISKRGDGCDVQVRLPLISEALHVRGPKRHRFPA